MVIKTCFYINIKNVVEPKNENSKKFKRKYLKFTGNSEFTPKIKWIMNVLLSDVTKNQKYFWKLKELDHGQQRTAAWYLSEDSPYRVS